MTSTDEQTNIIPDVPDIPKILEGSLTMAEMSRQFAMQRHRTDLGNAERFADRFGRVVKYDNTLKSFRWWTGSRWQIDNGGVARHLAGIVARSIYTEASNSSDQKERSALANWAQQSESKHRLTAMLDLAASIPEISTEAVEYDRHADQLNVLNGIVDLRSGKLSPHFPGGRHSKIAPVEYREDLLERDQDGVPRYVDAAPNFSRFLADITMERRDLMLYLQRLIGYGATGDATAQILAVLYGHGENGKSVLLKITRYVLGDYYQAAPPSLIVDDGKTGGASPEVARLHGVRLCEIEETGDGDKLNESKVKWLTGSDRLVARHLYGDFFEFDPQFTPVLVTNHRPRVKGSGHAIWRRLRLVPFEYQVPAERKDSGLFDKLKEEAPAVLAWIIEGAMAYYRGGMPASETIDSATQEYRRAEDTLAPFLKDRTIATGNVHRTALYSAYKEWCEAEGEYPMSPRRFNSQLRERGYEEIKDRVYGNLSLERGAR